MRVLTSDELLWGSLQSSGVCNLTPTPCSRRERDRDTRGRPFYGQRRTRGQGGTIVPGEAPSLPLNKIPKLEPRGGLSSPFSDGAGPERPRRRSRWRRGGSTQG